MSAASVQADAWVQQGFQRQNAGDAVAAEDAYRKALGLQGEHAAALQLLGLLMRRRGDEGQAEELMRRSLQIDPGQAHVWNNLGNLLHSLGRLEQALACFDDALARQATYAEAHYNRARTLNLLGRLPDAAQALQQAQALSSGPSAAMLQLQAQIEEGQGELDAALSTIERALQLAPERAALHHNRATLLLRRHRPALSLAAHERARALGLDVANAHYNHGNTLQSLGRLEEAAAAYRHALARQPGHALALYDLARLRWRQGDANFDAELLQASAAEPASAIAPGLHGQLLWRAGRLEQAAQVYARAIERAPQQAGLHDGLARCLVRLGRTEAGLLEHEHALALAPRDAALRIGHATSLLLAGRAAAAQEQAQAACDLAPDDQQALAVLGLAWRVLGDPREAVLNDVERFVEIHDLEAPPGFPDRAHFNAALALELQALHHDQVAPLDQTLRHGTQTYGDIFEQGHPLVDALKARITQAIDGYVSRLQHDATHAFLRRRSGGWRYTDSWSSRLSSGGFHTNHVHPHGWISSAYYVAVPDSTCDTQRCEGWLQFGEPDFDIGPSEAVRKRVQPRIGRLVLFPSMFWHGTTPFTEATQRLTIAFDVMPV